MTPNRTFRKGPAYALASIGLVGLLAMGACQGTPIVPASPTPTPPPTVPAAPPTVAPAPPQAATGAPSGSTGAASQGGELAAVPRAASPPAAASADSASSGIVVTGQGIARAQPDLGYVQLGVQSQGKTAQVAQDQNNQLMNAVLARVKGMGIAEKDIQTSGINLSPMYGRDARDITGYQAMNMVTIAVQDIARVGPVLDAAVAAGANMAGSVRFGFKDESALRNQSLEAAVLSARAKADTLAKALGVRVVGVVSVSEVSAGSSPMPVADTARVAVAQAAPAPAPVQAGELAVTAIVRVVYELGR